MRGPSIVALVTALLFSSACSNLKHTKVTEQNKREILSRIANGNEVTTEERHLLVEYTMRYKMAAVLQGRRPELPTGKTIAENRLARKSSPTRVAWHSRLHAWLV